MLNEATIKISVTRDFLKNKDNSSPKVKASCSSNQIAEQEYYKPAVELIYQIMKGNKENENENKICEK